MQIAIVRGTVVSNHRIPNLPRVKLLLVQFVDAQGQPLAEYEVAGDIVGAGINEWVLVSRGSAARQEEGLESRPLDALVVGIVETVTVENRSLYSKKDEEYRVLAGDNSKLKACWVTQAMLAKFRRN